MQLKKSKRVVCKLENLQTAFPAHAWAADAYHY